MSLRDRTITGISWNAAARLATQGLQVVIMVLLMRLLAPADFGLYAMLFVLIGAARIFGDFGLGPAIVQTPHLSSLQQHSVFWINLGIGVLLSVLFFTLAGPVAKFYDKGSLVLLAQVASLSFLLTALGIVPRALLQRAMAFDHLARVDISAVVISGVLAISIAWYGGGVWALLVQSLTREAATSLVAFQRVNWRPKLRYSFPQVRPLLRYGANILGFNFINYGAQNTDDFLIGKIFGSFSLGIYSRAYKLMLLPITHVISLVSRVMFPALSQIQADRPRVKRIYLRTMRILTFLTFPLMCGLFVTAEPFVLTVFGSEWTDLIPLLIILCPVGLTQTLNKPTWWIFQSQGRTDWMFRWGLFGSSSLILAIVVGVYLGSIETVAWAYLIANLILFYPCIAIPGKLIGMTVREVLKVSAGNLGCAFAMAVVVWLFAKILPTSWSTELRLLVQVITGVCVYAGLAFSLNLASYQDLRNLILERLKS